MGLGDILDAMFRLYRSKFFTFIGIVALLQVPMAIMYLAATMIFGDQMIVDMISLVEEIGSFDPQTDSFGMLPLGNIMAFYVVSFAIAMFDGLIVQQLIRGALVYATSQQYLGTPISMLGAYDFGIGRMLVLIVAAFLVAVVTFFLALIPFGLVLGFFFILASAMEGGGEGGVFLGLMLVGLLIAAVIVMVCVLLAISALFLFVPQAVILEGYDPLGALRRSWQLVISSFWRVLGTMLILYLMLYILSLIPSAMASGAIGLVFSDPFGDFAIRQALSSLVTYGAQILLLPIQFITFTLLYYDLRVRKEGLDLQVQAGSYAQEPGTENQELSTEN
jgi:hypothetical protein